VKVTIYDLNGREFKTLIDKQLDPKQHEISFETSDLPLGTYQVQILKKSGEILKIPDFLHRFCNLSLI
jgi:hypothetical protein